MSVTNEITQNIITNKLTDNIMMNFCKKVDEIQEKYIETFIVFENKLKNGDIINSEVEDKLNKIKEENLEYMICALSARKGFLNVLK